MFLSFFKLLCKLKMKHRHPRRLEGSEVNRTSLIRKLLLLPASFGIICLPHISCFIFLRLKLLFTNVFLAKKNKPRKIGSPATFSSGNKKKGVTHDNSSPDTKETPPPTNVEAHETASPPTTVRVPSFTF